MQQSCRDFLVDLLCFVVQLRDYHQRWAENSSSEATGNAYVSDPTLSNFLFGLSFSCLDHFAIPIAGSVFHRLSLCFCLIERFESEIPTQIVRSLTNLILSAIGFWFHPWNVEVFSVFRSIISCFLVEVLAYVDGGLKVVLNLYAEWNRGRGEEDRVYS